MELGSIVDGIDLRLFCLFCLKSLYASEVFVFAMNWMDGCVV